MSELIADTGRRLGRIMYEAESPALPADDPTAKAWQRVFGNAVLLRLLQEGWTVEPPAALTDGSDHAFKPGTTVDNDPPSDLWCDVCGESRAKAHPELIDGSPGGTDE